MIAPFHLKPFLAESFNIHFYPLNTPSCTQLFKSLHHTTPKNSFNKMPFSPLPLKNGVRRNNKKKKKRNQNK